MTHNEKVLALLSDGEPHSHHSLYALYVVAHSRISDLRKQGHRIEQWREGDTYFYQLVGALTEREVRGVAQQPGAALPQSTGLEPRRTDTAGVMDPPAGLGTRARVAASRSVSASAALDEDGGLSVSPQGPRPPAAVLVERCVFPVGPDGQLEMVS